LRADCPTPAIPSSSLLATRPGRILAVGHCTEIGRKAPSDSRKGQIHFDNFTTMTRQRREALQPGATPQGRVRVHVPPCKGGSFLRPCRAHRSILKPRALPWAGVRRRFQRRNRSCANLILRVLMVGNLWDGSQHSPKTKGDARYAICGRLSPMLVARSKAYASCRTPQSSLCRPTIWIPIGRPLAENAQGTEMAGFPTIEM